MWIKTQAYWRWFTCVLCTEFNYLGGASLTEGSSQSRSRRRRPQIWAPVGVERVEHAVCLRPGRRAACRELIQRRTIPQIYVQSTVSQPAAIWSRAYIVVKAAVASGATLCGRHITFHMLLLIDHDLSLDRLGSGRLGGRAGGGRCCAAAAGRGRRRLEAQ